MIHYPAYTVAAAHVAPVFLDADRSVEKACSVIAEAADRGARLDLARSVEPKQFHDVVGSYNRFDIFTLSVDRSARPSATFIHRS